MTLEEARKAKTEDDMIIWKYSFVSDDNYDVIPAAWWAEADEFENSDWEIVE